MPDTLADLVTTATLERRPALPGFLARKVIAGGRTADRARLPHERAAAAVLNVWGHLHPIECRIHDLTRRPTGTLRAQRTAAAADRYSEPQRYAWARRAEATLDDLRWYRAERRKLVAKFSAAVVGYRAARATIDAPELHQSQKALPDKNYVPLSEVLLLQLLTCPVNTGKH